MRRERQPCRMRLPTGYRCLRHDLGAIIRAYRRGEKGMGEPIPPKVFANDIGISRGALSRIENERAWPGPETLSRIMDAFEIDWPVVAERWKILARIRERQIPGRRGIRQASAPVSGESAESLAGRWRNSPDAAAFPHRSCPALSAVRSPDPLSSSGTRMTSTL